MSICHEFQVWQGRDPDRGVREMVRITRPGGVVAACMWDIAGGGMTMLRIFWTAVREVDPDARGERRMAGTVEGDIVERFKREGLEDVTGSALIACAHYEAFDDFWEPFTLEARAWCARGAVGIARA